MVVVHLDVDPTVWTQSWSPGSTMIDAARTTAVIDIDRGGQYSPLVAPTMLLMVGCVSGYSRLQLQD